MPAILGGQVSVGINGLAEFASPIEAGTVRVPGISSAEALADLDAPTLRDQSVDVDLERVSLQPPSMSRPIVDVVVVGGGNAGLCAALTAGEAGARVLVLESAPREFRGGNSRHTRNLRAQHNGQTAQGPDAYTEDEFLADLLKVTGSTDEALARLVVRRSGECPAWMQRHGARFQSSLRGTLHLGRTNAFFLGGGKALMNSYYAAAERMGIEVLYGAEVVGLEIVDGRFEAAVVQVNGQPLTVRARAAVLASGGFESNIDWLREVWGDAADNFIIRGTPYNKGRVLRLMLDAGAESVGDPRACHAVAVDARAPKFDGGIVTRLDCVSLGIAVNKHGERFYDEGEDFWPRRYAIWGALIAAQPDQIAFSIIDAKAVDRFMPSVFPPIVAQSICELARALDVPANVLHKTVAAFNAAVRPGSFDHSVLDDCRTEGLWPEKTHWAQRIDTPPFLGYPLRPGITFTYLGLKVNERARVLMTGGEPTCNIYAAGEIMAGNILRKGYVAGVGMTIGTVIGRIAGAEAAQHAAQ
jgi:tricarballylate dehydrogenase